jgi:hypothetical protein
LAENAAADLIKARATAQLAGPVSVRGMIRGRLNEAPVCVMMSQQEVARGQGKPSVL